ncbi:MAG TPA: hypothetical protein VL086_17580 [Candidatus Nitrosotalea sp.]|nr:hypothetical protein [Candidatus Nitrosotalea sp.]
MRAHEKTVTDDGLTPDHVYAAAVALEAGEASASGAPVEVVSAQGA